MPARKGRSFKRSDLKRASGAHAEAREKACAWAQKYIALRRAGLPTAAARAEDKANYWLRKMMALGTLIPRSEPPTAND
jgi:hypothetical protein